MEESAIAPAGDGENLVRIGVDNDMSRLEVSVAKEREFSIYFLALVYTQPARRK